MYFSAVKQLHSPLPEINQELGITSTVINIKDLFFDLDNCGAKKRGLV